MRLKLLIVLLPLLVTVKAEELVSGDTSHYINAEQPIHRIPRPLPQPILVREWSPSEKIIPVTSTEAQPENTTSTEEQPATTVLTEAQPESTPLPVKRPIQRPILRPAPRPVLRPVPKPIQQEPLPVKHLEPEPPQPEAKIPIEPRPAPQHEPVVTVAPTRPTFGYRPAARPFYRPAVRPPPRPVQTPAPLPIPEPTTPAPLPEPHTETLADPEPETERPISRPAPRPIPRPTVPRPVLRPAPRPRPPIVPQPVPRPVIRPTSRPKTTTEPEPLPQPDPLPAPTKAPPPKPVTRPPKPVWTPKPIPVKTTTQKPYNPARDVPNINEDLGTPIDFKCVQDGYYSVAGECDSYIQCFQRSALMFVCPDGLYFNKNARWSEYPCAVPSEVQCEAGAVIHEPQPTDQCPNQNGFFAMKDGDCSRYIHCEYGLASIMQCPPGLAFNVELSACDWPENVPSCNPKAFQGFTCPAPSPDEDPDWIYKYRHGKSCKYYIACQRGYPRLLSCDPGLAFDENAETCIDDQYVSNCSN